MLSRIFPTSGHLESSKLLPTSMYVCVCVLRGYEVETELKLRVNSLIRGLNRFWAKGVEAQVELQSVE